MSQFLIQVKMENLEEYIDTMVEFCLERGIARQMEAFKKGFSRVFPIEKLRAFTPAEVCTSCFVFFLLYS